MKPLIFVLTERPFREREQQAGPAFQRIITAWLTAQLDARSPQGGGGNSLCDLCTPEQGG